MGGKKNRLKNLHYAWVILLACCSMSVAGLSVFGTCMGVFLTPVSESLGVSRASFAMATTTVSGLLCGLLSPVAAKLLLRKNLRLVVAGAFGGMTVSLLLMSQARSLWLFALAFALSGISASPVVYVLTPVLINNWFRRRTAFALGIALGFSGVGGMVLSPLAARCIQMQGWEAAYLLFAAVVALFGLPPALFVIRLRPEERGLLPYGAGKEERAEEGSCPLQAREALRGVPKAKAFRSFSYLCLLLLAVLMMLQSAYFNHFPSYAPTVGLTAVFGASMISTSMLTNLGGKFLLGQMCDRWGIFKVNAGVLLLAGAGFSLLLLAGARTSLNLVAAFFYGFILPSTSMFLPLLVKALFGNRDYCEIYSYVVLTTTLASAGGVPLIAFLVEKTGSYQLPFGLGLGLALLCFLLLVLAFSSAKRLDVEERTGE